MIEIERINTIVFDWGRTLWDPDNERLFPDAVAILERLASDRTLMIVSLATKGEAEIARRRAMIATLGIAKLFSDIVFVTEEKDAAYESLYAKHVLVPNETAIVDDRTMRGIAWGNRVGSTTIWFRNGKFADELPDETTGEPTHIIHEFSELRRIFDLT